MPKEVKITDRNTLNGKRVPWASGTDIVKETTIKRGGVVKKKITEINVNDVLYGKPVIQKTKKIEKFDRSGNLKKVKIK